jgi:pimeloyl-ACP methyl ester carboxylesterase
MPPEIEFRTLTIRGAGVDLVADAYGDEHGSPVVLLHGGGQTRHAWGGTAAALAAAGWYAISLDQRGHGQSSWAPDGGYALVDFVSDLRGVIDQLHSSPVLVGASLGGIASMQAEGGLPHEGVAQHDARGVVLVDIAPRMERDGILKIVGFMRARPDGFTSLDEAADVIAQYLPHRKRPRDLSGLHKNLNQGEDGRWRWHWDPALAETWNPANFDESKGTQIHDERLAAAGRLTCPVLLVRGRMSQILSPEGAREFLDMVPHAEYVDL